MASTISCSETAMIRLTRLLMTAKFRSPIEDVPQAVGNRRRVRAALDSTRFERAPGVIRIGRLACHDFRARRNALHRQGCASQQSAAAHRADDHIERSCIREQLKRSRTLSGNHIPVVERVHKGKPMLLDQRRHGVLARPKRRLAGNDLRSITLGRRPLHRRRVPRHHHRHRYTREFAGERYGLGMVPRRMRDHATAALIVA